MDMVDKNNYEYAIPFYGVRRPILVDLVLHSNVEIEKKYTFKSERYHIRSPQTVEVWVSVLGRENRCLLATAAAIYNSVGAIESLRSTSNLPYTKGTTTLRCVSPTRSKE